MFTILVLQKMWVKGCEREVSVDEGHKEGGAHDFQDSLWFLQE